MIDVKLEEPSPRTSMSRIISSSKLQISPPSDSEAVAHVEQDACIERCCPCHTVWEIGL